ncbi:hypothetical protein WQ57_13935 [Mesobacillus campisalis]|uniref:Uncharacterized protein n=2 Tax=Mesobacillus campisalis TaxID=1408103 RepID=A0A0M2STS8_9BACI|nr:hypothetical protein WQ57_13935 [Mesobacillus campisalis]
MKNTRLKFEEPSIQNEKQMNLEGEIKMKNIIKGLESMDMNKEITITFTKEELEIGKKMLDEKIKNNPYYLLESKLEDELRILNGDLYEIEERINECSNVIDQIGIMGDLLSIREEIEQLLMILYRQDRTVNGLKMIDFNLPKLRENVEELFEKLEGNYWI